MSPDKPPSYVPKRVDVLAVFDIIIFCFSCSNSLFRRKFRAKTKSWAPWGKGKIIGLLLIRNNSKSVVILEPDLVILGRPLIRIFRTLQEIEQGVSG